MSMKSELTRRKLVEFLVYTAELERKLETVKQMLAEQPQFTPASLFYRFDSQRKGYIDERDVQDFLVDSNIEHTGLELKVLFGRMDENLDGKICLREFQDFILPTQNSKLRYETVRRQVFVPLPHQKLDGKIEWIAAKFFTEIIREYTRLKEYNTTLVSSYDFDHKSVFRMLSRDGESISFGNLQNFMAENDCVLTTEELGGIMRLLDKHGDGDIKPDHLRQYLATLNIKKESELLDELSPIPTIKAPGEKSGDKRVTFDMSNPRGRY
jgi:Ca2+-binding EF-hand superfamily protein